VWIGRRAWPYPAALAGVDVHITRSGRESERSIEYGVELRGEEQAGDGDPLALFEHSLFVDARPMSGTGRGPEGSGELLWASDRALRCARIGAVVLDGTGLSRTALRRLQLAAEAGGAIGIVLRPASETTQLSAAASRFVVARANGDGEGWPARWCVTPLRRRSAGRVRFGLGSRGTGSRGTGSRCTGSRGTGSRGTGSRGTGSSS
jgi:hypothetical protein